MLTKWLLDNCLPARPGEHVLPLNKNTSSTKWLRHCQHCLQVTNHGWSSLQIQVNNSLWRDVQGLAGGIFSILWCRETRMHPRAIRKPGFMQIRSLKAKRGWIAKNGDNIIYLRKINRNTFVIIYLVIFSLVLYIVINILLKMLMRINNWIIWICLCSIYGFVNFSLFMWLQDTIQSVNMAVKTKKKLSDNIWPVLLGLFILYELYWLIFLLWYLLEFLVHHH